MWFGMFEVWVSAEERGISLSLLVLMDDWKVLPLLLVVSRHVVLCKSVSLWNGRSQVCLVQVFEAF
jgi:hypothetical protein